MSKHAVKLDEYLSPDFRPENVANRLIKSTITPQETTVDISPALTRLKYDLAEIDQRMEEVARQNTEALLEHSSVVSTSSQRVADLEPGLSNVTGTFSKVEKDFLIPYRRSASLHSAGTRLHEVAILTRSLSWYLQLALQAQDVDYMRESYITAGTAGASMLRTAQALTTLNTIVTELPELERVAAVARFEERVPDLRAGLAEAATKLVNEFDGRHHGQLKLAGLTLLTLGVDLSGIVDTQVKTRVAATVSQLSRASSSAENWDRAFTDAQNRALTATALLTMRNELQGGRESAAGSAKHGGDPASAQKSPAASSSASPFWRDVVTQLDQKFKTMAVANPSAIKMLSQSREKVLASTSIIQELHDVFERYLNK